MAVSTESPRVERAFARAEAGRGLERAEALLLYERADLPSLLSAARSLRAHSKGRVITFSKKVFIPLTHLCRDYCGYCTFRTDPRADGRHYMTPDEVLAVAEAGRRAGCKEALFSLGDQPEKAFPEAREALRKLGHTRTLDYLAAMTELTLAQTGLLPHANPGLMQERDLDRLKESNASLGLMLENSNPRLMRLGGPHSNAPDKVPSLRLRTIEEAGRRKIAFTTGILIGIGEIPAERVDSLIALRAMHERFGHIQEVIIQNFRAKSGTPMALTPEPSLEELLRTIAVARLVLGSGINLQAPPNLSDTHSPRLLDAGINDWGGISPVTRDFINPEAPWPEIAQLAEKTFAAGLELRERLAIYPEFALRPEFTHPNLRSAVSRLADSQGFARDEREAHVQVA